MVNPHGLGPYGWGLEGLQGREETAPGGRLGYSGIVKRKTRNPDGTGSGTTHDRIGGVEDTRRPTLLKQSVCLKASWKMRLEMPMEGDSSRPE